MNEMSSGNEDKNSGNKYNMVFINNLKNNINYISINDGNNSKNEIACKNNKKGAKIVNEYYNFAPNKPDHKVFEDEINNNLIDSNTCNINPNTSLKSSKTTDRNNNDKCVDAPKVDKDNSPKIASNRPPTLTSLPPTSPQSPFLYPKFSKIYMSPSSKLTVLELSLSLPLSSSSSSASLCDHNQNSSINFSCFSLNNYLSTSSINKTPKDVSVASKDDNRRDENQNSLDVITNKKQQTNNDPMEISINQDANSQVNTSCEYEHKDSLYELSADSSSRNYVADSAYCELNISLDNFEVDTKNDVVANNHDGLKSDVDNSRVKVTNYNNKTDDDINNNIHNTLEIEKRLSDKYKCRDINIEKSNELGMDGQIDDDVCDYMNEIIDALNFFDEKIDIYCDDKEDYDYDFNFKSNNAETNCYTSLDKRIKIQKTEYTAIDNEALDKLDISSTPNSEIVNYNKPEQIVNFQDEAKNSLRNKNFFDDNSNDSIINNKSKNKNQYYHVIDLSKSMNRKTSKKHENYSPYYIEKITKNNTAQESKVDQNKRDNTMMDDYEDDTKYTGKSYKSEKSYQDSGCVLLKTDSFLESSDENDACDDDNDDYMSLKRELCKNGDDDYVNISEVLNEKVTENEKDCCFSNVRSSDIDNFNLNYKDYTYYKGLYAGNYKNFDYTNYCGRCNCVCMKCGSYKNDYRNELTNERLSKHKLIDKNESMIKNLVKFNSVKLEGACTSLNVDHKINQANKTSYYSDRIRNRKNKGEAFCKSAAKSNSGKNIRGSGRSNKMIFDMHQFDMNSPPAQPSPINVVQENAQFNDISLSFLKEVVYNDKDGSDKNKLESNVSYMENVREGNFKEKNNERNNSIKGEEYASEMSRSDKLSNVMLDVFCNNSNKKSTKMNKKRFNETKYYNSTTYKHEKMNNEKKEMTSTKFAYSYDCHYNVHERTRYDALSIHTKSYNNDEQKNTYNSKYRINQKNLHPVDDGVTTINHGVNNIINGRNNNYTSTSENNRQNNINSKRKNELAQIDKEEKHNRIKCERVLNTKRVSDSRGMLGIL